jgi:hypothetical protein
MSQQTLHQLRRAPKEAGLLVTKLIDGVEQKMLNPSDGVALDNSARLINLMRNKRRTLGLSLDDLGLQTDISTSTLKRLFADPDSARFSNVITVLKELGIKSWAEL